MSDAERTGFAHWAAVWRLTPDGQPIRTRTSRLLPVRTGDGELAMLKVAAAPEEQAGAAMLAWWDGQGAARVLEQEAEALLIERATGFRSLAEMAKTADDEEATRILCRTIARLHEKRLDRPPAGLVPLDNWFRDLWPAAERHGGLLARCAETARELLADPVDVRPLHGDVHHDNVLDFGARGWLAIDPKGVLGERGFDYANMFRNPSDEIARAPGRMGRLVGIVSEESGIEPRRLLRWVLAWCGLSAVWAFNDGETAAPDLSVCEIAARELDQLST